jgi:hypothetical protein
LTKNFDKKFLQIVGRIFGQMVGQIFEFCRELRIIFLTTNDNCAIGNTVGGNLTKVSSAKKQTKKIMSYLHS